MSKLNAHLFTTQQAESTNCHCGHKLENVKHYFLHCPSYIKQQKHLYESISNIICEDYASKSDSDKLPIILHGTTYENEKKNIALAQYVQNYVLYTKRFNATF